MRTMTCLSVGTPPGLDVNGGWSSGKSSRRADGSALLVFELGFRLGSSLLIRDDMALETRISQASFRLLVGETRLTSTHVVSSTWIAI